MLSQFKFDFWTLFGFLAQFVFFMRFVVQWVATEKAKTSVFPTAFWYISIVGSLMLMVYAWQRRDIVFVVGMGLSLLIYLRNIYFIRRKKNVVV